MYLYRLENTLPVVQGSKVFGNVEPDTADSRQEVHQDWNNLTTKGYAMLQFKSQCQILPFPKFSFHP